jgi:hypothetical protein
MKLETCTSESKEDLRVELRRKGVWLIKMVECFEQERVTREWNRWIQGETEHVMKFFER